MYWKKSIKNTEQIGSFLPRVCPPGTYKREVDNPFGVLRAAHPSRENLSKQMMDKNVGGVVEKRIDQPRYFNQCFDKGRLKNFVLWFLKNYGEKKTVQLVEQLKTVGFDYAAKAGISLGVDDLKIPPKKLSLIYEAEKQTTKTVTQYVRGEITGVERFQRLIDTWHRTSESLKQEVIDYFEATDILNPVYMMAFSGARGNISQVRQLVGMRGLMADPQGQIIDFPIRSNFREGLTLTEYIISSYGARKGIVDTALRTANAGYLTRRLVDVAQHVIISNFDCGTRRGIFLKDMKEGNKTIHSLSQRLVGRILARDLVLLTEKNEDSSKSSIKKEKTLVAKRNDEVTLDLALEIAKKFGKVFVRSPLTCETNSLICQLCYGWSLGEASMVSIGEAVGVVAAQSIGEPGTQLTMRTFHTGGVFSGDISDQIRAPYKGIVEFKTAIPGTLIRTPEGKIAFLTKGEGSFFVSPLKNGKVETETKVKFKIPSYTLLYIRNGQTVYEKEVIAQMSSISRNSNATDDAELTIKSEYEGQFYSKSIVFREKFVGPDPVSTQKAKKEVPVLSGGEASESDMRDKINEAWTWGYAWILSGKIYELNLRGQNLFPKLGDSVNNQSSMVQTNWNLNLNSGVSRLLFSHPSTLQAKGFGVMKTLSSDLLTSQKMKNNGEMLFPKGTPSIKQETNVQVVQNLLHLSNLEKIRFKGNSVGYVLKQSEPSTLGGFRCYKGTSKSLTTPEQKNVLVFTPSSSLKSLRNSIDSSGSKRFFGANIQNENILQVFPMKYHTFTGGLFLFENLPKQSSQNFKRKTSHFIQRATRNGVSTERQISYVNNRRYTPLNVCLQQSGCAQRILYARSANNTVKIARSVSSSIKSVFIKETRKAPVQLLLAENRPLQNRDGMFGGTSSSFQTTIPMSSPMMSQREIRFADRQKATDVFPSLVMKRKAFGLRWKNAYQLWGRIENNLLSQNSNTRETLAEVGYNGDFLNRNRREIQKDTHRILWIPKEYYRIHNTLEKGSSVQASSKKAKKASLLTYQNLLPVSQDDFSYFYNKKIPLFIQTNRQGSFKPFFTTLSFASLLKISKTSHNNDAKEDHSLSSPTKMTATRSLKDQQKSLLGKTLIKNQKKVSSIEANRRTSLRDANAQTGASRPRFKKPTNGQNILKTQQTIRSFPACNPRNVWEDKKSYRNYVRILFKTLATQEFSRRNCVDKDSAHTDVTKKQNLKSFKSFCSKSFRRYMPSSFDINSQKSSRNVLFLQQTIQQRRLVDSVASNDSNKQKTGYALCTYSTFIKKQFKNLQFKMKEKLSVFMLSKNFKQSLNIKEILNKVYSRDNIRSGPIFKKSILYVPPKKEFLTLSKLTSLAFSLANNSNSGCRVATYNEGTSNTHQSVKQPISMYRLPNFGIPTFRNNNQIQQDSSNLTNMSVGHTLRGWIYLTKSVSTNCHQKMVFPGQKITTRFTPRINPVGVRTGKSTTLKETTDFFFDVPKAIYIECCLIPDIYNIQNTKKSSSNSHEETFKNGISSSEQRHYNKKQNTDLKSKTGQTGFTWIKNTKSRYYFTADFNPLQTEQSQEKGKNIFAYILQPVEEYTPLCPTDIKNSLLQSSLQFSKGDFVTVSKTDDVESVSRWDIESANRCYEGTSIFSTYNVIERTSRRGSKSSSGRYAGLKKYLNGNSAVNLKSNVNPKSKTKRKQKSKFITYKSVVPKERRLIVNKSLDSFTKWKQYKTNQYNKQERTNQPLAKFPTSDIIFLPTRTLSFTNVRERRVDYIHSSIGQNTSNNTVQEGVRSQILPMMACEVRRPLNLFPFILTFKRPMGLDYSFKNKRFAISHSPISQFDSAYYPTLSRNFSTILGLYLSKIKNLHSLKNSANDVKKGRSLRDLPEGRNMTFGSVEMNTVNRIFDLLPHLFETPLFSFNNVLQLNSRFYTKHIDMSQTLLKTKKKIAFETLFTYSPKNEMNFVSRWPLAKTTSFSPFNGEVVSLNNPTESASHSDANVRSTSTSCMILTKNDLISYYLPSYESSDKRTPLTNASINKTKRILSNERHKNEVANISEKINIKKYSIDNILVKFINMSLEQTKISGYNPSEKTDGISFVKDSINNIESQNPVLLKISNIEGGVPSNYIQSIKSKNNPSVKKLRLGEFFVFGDQISDTTGIHTSGQLVHYNSQKITIRRSQPIFISPKGILHKSDNDFIDPKTPVITLSYQRLKTGDIIQGIPKVEQFFEARTTKRGRLFRDSLPSLLRSLFKRYRAKLPLELAVRQSFYKIQQILVDGVHRVYKSQGVTISDKHLEVIVKQMTSKVRIIDGAQTGFFPGEVVDLFFVEKINKFLIKKLTYEPLVLGITKASLEVDSFLSAASFQQTTRVLSKAALYRQKDFLKGLKENILLGNLIPAGTGFLVYLDSYSLPR